MNLIAFLNVCACGIFAASIGVVVVAVARRRIHRSAAIFAAISVAIMMFVCVSNVLEHTSITQMLDDYEGLAKDLSALFFMLFLYVDSIQRELDRRAANERQIQEDLEEKTTLLKEVHHRVKNNLQIVSSLLSLQDSRQRDGQVSEIINTARNRILSIAAVHEIIYSARSISRIEAPAFIDAVLSNLIMTYDPGKFNVDIVRSLEGGIELDVDCAIPVGLIVNELLTNSLKHAFRGKTSGRIEISLKRAAGAVELCVSDNGTGMAAGQTGEPGKGIGMELVRSLAQQIRGKLTIATDDGSSVLVVFPDAQGAPRK
ncbi:MAG: sensor histidine kinase [Spirochaetes bacterium]|nr:sensor histidine kinase [Spirochaetota bacterium]